MTDKILCSANHNCQCQPKSFALPNIAVNGRQNSSSTNDNFPQQTKSDFLPTITVQGRKNHSALLAITAHGKTVSP